eukprot:2689218-Prymnesium_polylepis.2
MSCRCRLCLLGPRTSVVQIRTGYGRQIADRQSLRSVQGTDYCRRLGPACRVPQGPARATIC